MRQRLRIGIMGFVLGCGGAPETSATKRPEILGDKCGMTKQQAAPLIVDWSSAQRSRLEAGVRKGPAVAVRIDGCEIEPLWQCELPASYGYVPSSVRREAERIADRGSLYARIPTTAVALEAKIEAGSELQVAKTTVGRFELLALNLAENQLRGQCSGATHFVSAVDVGAFEFSAGRSFAADAKVEVGNAGGGVSRSSDHQVLATDGEIERCATEGPSPGEPREGCRAPIQIDLTPLVPSLTKDEFIAIAVEGTQKVFDTCSLAKKLHGDSGASLLIYLVAEPSGALSPRFPERHPPPEFDACIESVWSSLRVEPFAGPAVVLSAEVYDLSMQPGQTRESVLDIIEKFYTHNFSQPDPGIPPRGIGAQIYYDYAKNGVTATEAWQVPGAW